MSESVRREALRAIAGAGAVLVAFAWALSGATPHAAIRPLAGSLAVFALGAWLLLRHLDAHRPQPRFGLANRVTLLRLVLVALAGGALLELERATATAPTAGSARLAEAVAAIATAGWLFDGVDGWLARRRGEASAFGARFDMETDAALVMVLCLHAWLLGRVGAWVLVAGLLRYVFVAAGSRWDWLQRPLPPSRLRRLVCAVLTGCLIVCIAPAVTPVVQQLAAATGTLLVVVSFARDVRWLALRRDLALPATA